MKRFFRTTLALTLAAALLLTGCFALAQSSSDPESIPFDTSLANAVDRSASEWMSSSWSRALVSVLLTLDLSLGLDDDADSPDLSKPSYVGITEDHLVVILHGDSHVFLIVYDPAGGIGVYVLLSEVSDSAIESTMANMSDSYYQNSLSDIYDVAQTLQEIIASNG